MNSRQPIPPVSEGRGATELLAQLRSRQFLTIGIGAIMGVGWVIVLGEWLRAAAPLGAILGFVAGGLFMLPAARLRTGRSRWSVRRHA